MADAGAATPRRKPRYNRRLPRARSRLASSEHPKPSERSLRVEGCTLAVTCHGDVGPAVVVAHGLMGSTALAARFGESAAALAARGFRVVSYDARGHGRSEGSGDPADYAWARHARDLAGVIEGMSLAPASVYGGSMGAGSALLLAAARPELVHRLVLRAPPPFGGDLAAARRLFLPLAALYAWLGPEWTARIVTSLPPVKRLQRETPENDFRSFFGVQRPESVAAAIRGLVREREPIAVAIFPKIPHPTLVLAHPGDPIHPLRSAEHLRAGLPSVEVFVAPDARWYTSHPEALVERVAAFLRGGAAE